MADANIDLFAPYDLGKLRLKNRFVMAPLTRCRAEAGNVPSAMAPQYYASRAGAGLIVTEATQVSSHGQGYIFTPGIHSAEQVAGWQRVTEAVHQAGGLIFLQLWHVGRISHPDFLHGQLPVAPSAIAPRGVSTYTPEGIKEVPTPRALATDEIPGIVEEFRLGARSALAAGFDGVEIHGANGYLIDQFLEDGTNHRTDRYGGSVENRVRFLLEVVDAVASVWGSQRVGVRLSPGGSFNDMADSHPQATFGHALSRLGTQGLAYVHLVEPDPTSGEHPTPDLTARHFRPLYPGTLIVAKGYTLERAQGVVRGGLADLVAFGQPFLANPDLVERFRRGATLNTPDPDTFYAGGARGYIDYPTLDAPASP